MRFGLRPYFVLFVLASTVFISGCPMLQGIAPVVESGPQAPTTMESQTATRQALLQGVNAAVAVLGKEGGFSSTAYRLPLPENLRQTAERARAMGLGRYVDDFEMSLNRAAEKAVPEAVDVFKTSVAQMSFQDVVAILQGGEHAATDYFKRTSEAQLEARFKPIVTRATSQVGVTEQYKKLSEKVAYYGRLVGYEPPVPTDLDGYITNEATGALFDKMAKEEALIRQDPVARGTQLLKKVFGFYTDSGSSAPQP
ncbi:conserved hypothetical protein [gamma proteobacterium HTCC5015]|nr:conserved hypothetical protein [gamma proteobacterium HTCC5015]